MPLKVLFASVSTSNTSSCYTQRLSLLKGGIEQCGIFVDILYLGDYFIRSPFFAEALNIPMLKKEVDGYDVIHGGAANASYVMSIMKNFCRFKLIYDVHGSPEDVLLNERLGFSSIFSYFEEFMFEQISLRYSDFFITCSKPLRNNLLRRGIDKLKVEVIRNGVDTKLFAPQEISSNGSKFVVTYGGAFQRWQGIENLIAAATSITDPSVSFKIIGFRKKDSVLKTKIERMLTGKAELINSLSQIELVQQLRLSDILLIPRSRHRVTQLAFPTKFAEYIATGKPVIVTDVDETADFVRKYNCGFVCEPSAKSIAKAIIKAKQTPTEDLLEMGRNGRKLAESQFDWRIIGKQYFEFLQRILFSNKS